MLTGEAATVCWLGDSRAYWLADGPDGTPRRLTADDSLAEEMVATGLLSEADAMASPHAHVVTRWVGADAEDAAPHLTTFQPPGPGVLMLCSDGLWNYQPDAAELAAWPSPGPGPSRWPRPRTSSGSRWTRAAMTTSPWYWPRFRRSVPSPSPSPPGPPSQRPATARPSRKESPPMSQPDFTIEIFQNEYLPDGGREVNAIVTVTSGDTVAVE